MQVYRKGMLWVIGNFHFGPFKLHVILEFKRLVELHDMHGTSSLGTEISGPFFFFCSNGLYWCWVGIYAYIAVSDCKTSVLLHHKSHVILGVHPVQ